MEAHGAEKSLRMKNNLGPLVPGSLSKQKNKKRNKSYPLHPKEIGTLASILFWVKCIIYSIHWHYTSVSCAIHVRHGSYLVCIGLTPRQLSKRKIKKGPPRMSKKKLSEKLCVACRTGNFVKCGDLMTKGANPNYQVSA